MNTSRSCLSCQAEAARDTTSEPRFHQPLLRLTEVGSGDGPGTPRCAGRHEGCPAGAGRVQTDVDRRPNPHAQEGNARVDATRGQRGGAGRISAAGCGRA